MEAGLGAFRSLPLARLASDEPVFNSGQEGVGQRRSRLASRSGLTCLSPWLDMILALGMSEPSL